jgi:hypothetical protein
MLYGLDHSYRGHGYNNEQYSTETLANQQKAYRFLQLRFDTAPSELGEVHFFGSNGLKLTPSNINTTPAGDGATLANLKDDTLETTWVNSLGSQTLSFDFGSPTVIEQYEIGAGSNALSLSWQLSGSISSADGPWEQLDSTPSAQSISATSFAVTVLGEHFRCPSVYDAATSFEYTTQEMAAVSPDGLSCADACDTKGLACTAFVFSDASCALFGTDVDSAMPLLSYESTASATTCLKAGLMNCSATTCTPVDPTTTTRRLEAPIPQGAAQRSHQLTLPTATTRSFYGSRVYPDKFTTSLERRNMTSSDDSRFLCSNGRTIEQRFACDLIDDCGDKSDESACAKNKAGDASIDSGVASMLTGLLGGEMNGAPLMIGIHTPICKSCSSTKTSPTAHSIIFDLEVPTPLMMASLQRTSPRSNRSQRKTALRFRLQAMAVDLDAGCGSCDSGDESSSCGSYVTIAMGALPPTRPHHALPPVDETYSPGPTLELLLQGQQARCLRLVLETEHTDAGAGGASMDDVKLEVFRVSSSSTHSSSTHSSTAALVSRLLSPASAETDCASCPTFTEEKATWLSVLFSLAFFFVVAFCCCFPLVQAMKRRQYMSNTNKINQSTEYPCANGIVRRGTRVQTCWTAGEGGDGSWYIGTVTWVDAQGQCSVEYDDGTDDWIGSTEHVFLLQPAVTASHPVAVPVAATPYPSSAQGSGVEIPHAKLVNEGSV